MSEERTGQVLRLAGELAIVFIGVLLALAADGFRERSAERAEARQGLSLLLADLRADSSDFARLSRTSHVRVASLAWLLERWEGDAPPRDSLEYALYQLSTRNSFTLNSVAYSGMVTANRIRLLEPDSLRDAIVQFYESRHQSISDWAEDIDELEGAILFGALPKHVIHPLGMEPGSLWPVANEAVRVRSSWSEIQQDAEFHNLLVQRGRVAEYFADMARDAEAEAAELLAAIRHELGTAPVSNWAFPPRGETA